MEKKSDWLDGILKASQKPIIPEPPEEDRFDEMVAFPDKDATEEEIAEYLKK